METVELTLGGRTYKVACEPHERAQLLACASYVDQKMEAIRANGRVLGADRIAVMAALQIAQELMSAKSADGLPLAELKRRLREMANQVDALLAPQEPLFP
ncbi:MAG: cell division protein ZapA [Sutterellaceae bacterium]|nr:cell division protein ZapA [Burkholderiaceae bacterium]MDW8430177.1 cell division protein ZapA [Sutterellaceae bacterium]